MISYVKEFQNENCDYNNVEVYVIACKTFINFIYKTNLRQCGQVVAINRHINTDFNYYIYIVYLATLILDVWSTSINWYNDTNIIKSIKLNLKKIKFLLKNIFSRISLSNTSSTNYTFWQKSAQFSLWITTTHKKSIY